MKAIAVLQVRNTEGAGFKGFGGGETDIQKAALLRCVSEKLLRIRCITVLASRLFTVLIVQCLVNTIRFALGRLTLQRVAPFLLYLFVLLLLHLFAFSPVMNNGVYWL